MAGKVDESSLDTLAAGCKTLEDVASLYTQMLQRVIDRGLNAELDAHLIYARHGKGADGARTNTRNGSLMSLSRNALLFWTAHASVKHERGSMHTRSE